jgi:hypothetical protein
MEVASALREQGDEVLVIAGELDRLRLALERRHRASRAASRRPARASSFAT